MDNIDFTKMSYIDLGLLKARIEQAMELQRCFNQDKHKDWIGKTVVIDEYGGDSKFYGIVIGCSHDNLLLRGYELGDTYIDSYSEETFRLDDNSKDKIKEITKKDFQSAFKQWAKDSWEYFWTGITEE